MRLHRQDERAIHENHWHWHLGESKSDVVSRAEPSPRVHDRGSIYSYFTLPNLRYPLDPSGIKVQGRSGELLSFPTDRDSATLTHTHSLIYQDGAALTWLGPHEVMAVRSRTRKGRAASLHQHHCITADTNQLDPRSTAHRAVPVTPFPRGRTSDHSDGPWRSWRVTARAANSENQGRL